MNVNFSRKTSVVTKCEWKCVCSIDSFLETCIELIQIVSLTKKLLGIVDWLWDSNTWVLKIFLSDT